MKIIRILLFLSIAIFPIQSFANYSILEKTKYIFLVDQDTGEVLLEKNADQQISPSSMTKLMTAYVVFNQLKEGKISLNDKCVIGRDAWKKKGSQMLLGYKDVATIHQLVSGLLIVSGNDAAVALAQAISGSVEDFANLMNKTANEIGLKNSHFKNPHGLNQDNHYSSLRDLALLSSKISNDFPEYLHYFSTDKLSYNDNVRKNHNPLIKYNYQGATGMKTGMTRKGGYGMVGTAKRGSKKLIAVTNNLKSSKERREVVTAMLDYGFNDYTKVNILNKGDEIASAKTWLGKKNDVDLIVGENVQINIQNSQMSNDINLEVNYESPIYAPILKGQKIANLIITIADKKIKEVPLFAKENIDKTSYFNRIYRTTRYKFYQFLNILK